MKTVTTSRARATLAGDQSVAVEPAPSAAPERRFWRRRHSAAASVEVEPLAEQWTGGSQLLARAAAVLIALALVAGPVAFLRSWFTPAPVAATSSTSLSPAMLARQSAAREVAARALTAYLTTPAEQASSLATWWPAGTVTLPKVAPTISEVEVLTVAATAPGVWTVTLGATVTGPAPAEPPAPSPSASPPAPVSDLPSVPTRRYYQLPMQVAGGVGDASAVPITLPALVPGPGVGSSTRQVYGVTAASTGPAGVSVQGFLTALLTGTGDLTRWITPGSVIQPVTPAPFAAVSVSETRADVSVDGLSSGSPADGAQAHVIATAIATGADAQTQTVQYLLHLTARAGRWEVTALDSAPAAPLPPARSQ